MSLISQQDKELAIEALKFYSQKIDQNIFDEPNKRKMLQNKKNQIMTLLKWIELEHYKNS